MNMKSTGRFLCRHGPDYQNVERCVGIGKKNLWRLRKKGSTHMEFLF